MALLSLKITSATAVGGLTQLAPVQVQAAQVIPIPLTGSVGDDIYALSAGTGQRILVIGGAAPWGPGVHYAASQLATFGGQLYVRTSAGISAGTFAADASNWQVVVSALNGVVVTGTPTAGQVLTATSPTAAIWTTPAAPTNTVLPAITGSTVQGQTLTASTGTWTAWINSTITYAYQWQRGGLNIAGATASTYVLQSTDVGSTIDVIVTATTIAGSLSATSAATATVTAFAGAFIGILGTRSTVGGEVMAGV